MKDVGLCEKVYRVVKSDSSKTNSEIAKEVGADVFLVSEALSELEKSGLLMSFPLTGKEGEES